MQTEFGTDRELGGEEIFGVIGSTVLCGRQYCTVSTTAGCYLALVIMGSL